MFRKDYIYMDYLRDEVVMSEEEKKVFNDLKVSIFAKLLFDDINSKIPNVLDFDYLLIILRLKSNFIKSHFNMLPSTDFFDRYVHFFRDLYKEKYLSSLVSDAIVNNLKNYVNGITLRELDELLPKSFVVTGVLPHFLDNLKELGYVEKNNSVYSFKFMSVIDYLKQKNDRKAVITLKRLNGRTLEDVGTEYNLTRERIRQIVDSVLLHHPNLYEDRYAYWYKKYNFNKEDFCLLFNVEGYVYRYLWTLWEKGSLPIAEIQNDSNVSDNLLLQLQKVLNKDKYKILDEYVTGSRMQMIASLMKQCHTDKIVHVDEVIKELEECCKENHFDPCITSRRSLIGKVLESDFVIASFRNKGRYYDFNVYPINKLFDALNLKQYKNVTISTSKIFRENKKLMKAFDIRNEYELHNVFKKNKHLLPNTIEVSRMPYLNFGNYDRGRQVFDVIKMYAPISRSELASLFNTLYGIDKRTFLVNWIQPVEQYYRNGMYQIERQTENVLGI